MCGLGVEPDCFGVLVVLRAWVMLRGLLLCPASTHGAVCSGGALFCEQVRGASTSTRTATRNVHAHGNVWEDEGVDGCEEGHVRAHGWEDESL